MWCFPFWIYEFLIKKTYFIIEINSLTFGFLIWERVSDSNIFYFSKIIRIIDYNKYLIKCKYFREDYWL